jgi:hypothetical protein
MSEQSPVCDAVPVKPFERTPLSFLSRTPAFLALAASWAVVQSAIAAPGVAQTLDVPRRSAVSSTQTGFLGLTGQWGGQARPMWDLGWRFMRTPIGWHEVLTRKGRLDWGKADARVRLAFDAGLRIQVCLDFAWPRGLPCPFPLDAVSRLPVDAQGQSALRLFVDQAVARYRGIAQAYGAEEDLSAGSFPGGPTIYAQVLLMLSSALQASDPGVPLVFGAVAFDTQEEDARVFFVSDTIRALSGRAKMFDALELRLIGQNARTDYRRARAALSHIRGQLAHSAYENTPIILLSSSPTDAQSPQGQSEQAADLVRRVLTAGDLGLAKFCWGGGLIDQGPSRPHGGLARFTDILQRSGLSPESSSRDMGRRKALGTARLLGRLDAKFDLARTRIVARSRTLFQASLKGEGLSDLTVVWRDYFLADQSYDSVASIALKTFEIEGPKRRGLHALKMVPDSTDRLRPQPVDEKYISMDGSPVILSKDVSLIYTLAGLRPPPPTPTPTPTPTAMPAPAPASTPAPLASPKEPGPPGEPGHFKFSVSP